MGMYFNTAATTEMNEKINNAFSGGNIDFWKNSARRNLFGKIGEGGASLASIAGQSGLFPNAGYNSGVGKRWFKWLDDLEANANASLREHFFKHLDPNGKCMEIIFHVSPKASLPISIRARRDPASGNVPYTLIVNIETPTARAVREAIKKKMKSRKKAKT